MRKTILLALFLIPLLTPAQQTVQIYLAPAYYTQLRHTYLQPAADTAYPHTGWIYAFTHAPVTDSIAADSLLFVLCRDSINTYRHRVFRSAKFTRPVSLPLHHSAREIQEHGLLKATPAPNAKTLHTRDESDRLGGLTVLEIKVDDKGFTWYHVRYILTVEGDPDRAPQAMQGWVIQNDILFSDPLAPEERRRE